MKDKRLFDKLISFMNKLSKHKTTVMSLAVAVVFVTTYLLILPALTLEKDEAIKQGGIDIETDVSTDVSDVDETIDQDEVDEDSDYNGNPFESTENIEDSEAAVSEDDSDSVDITDRLEADAEEYDVMQDADSEASISANEEPSSDKESETTYIDEDLDVLEIDKQLQTYMISDTGETYVVEVTYDETSEIPEDAELRVKEIEEGDEAYSNFRENIGESLDEAGTITAKPLLLDISILADGKEIEPAEGSEVKVEIRLVKDAMDGTYTGIESPVLVNNAPLTEENTDMEKSMQIIHQKSDGELEVMETKDEVTKDSLTSEFTTDSFSDWLLFLDEDLTSIIVHEGDTLTLRPYTEWVWKKTDLEPEYQGGEWIFPTNAWSQSTSSEYVPPVNNWDQGKTIDFTDYTSTGAGSGQNKFHVFEKTDNELIETYNVTRSDPLRPGQFDIQTNKGKTIHVTVLPGPSNAKPPTVEGITGIDGLKVNLFDYDVPGNGDSYDFTKSGSLDAQANTASLGNTSWGNYGINAGHDLKILGYGGTNYPNYGRDRQWFAINDYTKDVPKQGIVQNTLVGGYPSLGPSTNGNTRENPSLQYLFDTASRDHNVYAFPDADGLFQKDNLGYYFYNSNVNYAEYNRSSNTFTLYEHTYSQDTSGSGGANAKPIGFFPFHEYDTNNTQPGMNFNTNLNHHFGMSMEVNFEIPTDRRAPDDYGYKHDIIYEFSGDDDLWVFVDDELVLDIGGIHQPITGSINFTTGVIKVHGVEDKTTTFDVGTHTLKMFYIERGGCDSNLSVRFNLPLVLGDGNINLRKKSAATDDHSADTALSGATFGIWDNPDCEGEPYTIATSDSNGLIFKDLPIRSEDQVYYMQEMYPPDGYLLDRTIYTLTAEKVSAGNYKFNVSVDGQSVTDIEPGTGFPIIRNRAADDIDVSVLKKWEDADGSPLEPEETSATFTVKRTRTYTADNTDLIKVRLIGYKRGNNNEVIELDEELDELYSEIGDVLTIKYRHSPSPPGPDTPGEILARRRSRYYTVATLTVNGEGTDQTITYTVAEADRNNDTIDLLVPEAFTDWCNGREYANGDNPHFTGYGRPTHEFVTEEDTTFSRTITVTKQSSWKGVAANLPVFEKIGNTAYYYDYYIEETQVPAGYEAVYYQDGKPIAGSASPSTNESGEMEVVNRKLMDVPIEKAWPDFSGDSFTWEATFQLEEMEVKVNADDPDADDAIDEFTPVQGKRLTIQKDQDPQPAFTGLPMYRTHSNGTVYRILYSVDEVSYKVTRTGDGATVVSWSQDGSIDIIGDTRYEPIFHQDAGEHGDSIGDYEIIVLNDLENRVLDKSIDISIDKIWPEGSSYATDNNTFARFVLKRYVHEEYRDYSNYSGDWVTVSLDTGQHAAGEEHILQTVTVPKGSTIHITGSIKAGTNANSIVFRQTAGDNITYTMNNPDTSPLAFDINFKANQYNSIELYQGDNYVVGGRDGFILSSYTNKTNDALDTTFEEDFILNKTDGWHRVFEYLPLVEEQNIDPATGAQTVYVYSYYIEEVDSNPADFYPVFSTEFGSIGDKDHRIEADTSLTAQNLQKTVDLTLDKVDEADVDKENAPKLEGAAFKLEKYTSDNFQQKDIAWGINGEKILTEKTNPKGEFTLDGLTVGFYKVVETAYPEGYVKNGDDPIFEVRLNSTTKNLEIILLKFEGEGDETHVVVVEDNKTDLVRVDLNTVIVGNEPGAALPNAGGIGTTVFYIMGTMLVLGCGIYLISRRRIRS